MSGGSWIRVLVQCPFYKHDDSARVITCEGVVPDTDTKTRFRCRAEREKHMEIFCCEGYRTCEVYQALMQRYEEE